MNRRSYCGELVGKSAKGHVVRGRMAGTGDPAIAPPKKMVCVATLCLALQPEDLPGGEPRGRADTGQRLGWRAGGVRVARLRDAGMLIKAP